MKNRILVALILGLVGAVFLVGGTSAAVYTLTDTVKCPVCGMTISKTAISTDRVVTSNGVTHWVCDPLCAAELAIYYQNAVIYAKCYISGRTIQIDVVNGNVTTVSVSPSSPQDDVLVVMGGSGMQTCYFVSTQSYANQLLQKYSSNPNATIMTLQETFMMAQMMMGTMTPSFQSVQIPAINYVLMNSGAGLIAVAPISWKILKNRSIV